MKSYKDVLNCRILVVVLLITISSGCNKDITIPNVTTGTVTQITRTSAKVEGNTNNSGGASSSIGQGICWSNINVRPYVGHGLLLGGSGPPYVVPSTEYWSWVGNGTNTFKGEMTELTPGTNYFVWAVASNLVGTGFGNVVSFSTIGNMSGEILFNPNSIYGTITDLDGNSYKTIQIGEQTWMAENLKTTKYNDGTDIPNVSNFSEWKHLTSPAYCWYVNDLKYKTTYGALYNGYTVNTGKLCPAGWHVPSTDEWTVLIDYLGDNLETLPGLLREVDTIHWVKTSSSVINSSGFTALPGGWRNRYNINFGELGYSGNFWTSTTTGYPQSVPGSIEMTIIGNYEFMSRGGFFESGLSVRCLKD